MFTTKISTAKMVMACAMLLAAASAVQARTWRLNPKAEAKPDFTSLKEAKEDERVKAGDELLLDPGVYDESSPYVKDSVTVTGSGYFFDTDQDRHSVGQTIIATAIKLGKGSTIQGCTINSNVDIAGDNVTVRRCKIRSGVSYGDTYAHQYTNINIEQNYIGNGISVKLNKSTIRNNIMLYSIRPPFRESETAEGCKIEYNTIVAKGTAVISGVLRSEIKNNILIGSENAIEYCTTPKYYNTCSNNVYSTTKENASADYPNNYYVGATVENTFVDEIVADRYFLREGSPAKGRATDGGDCGAFGGRNPYVLSGIPKYMPHITDARIPAKPTNGTLKVQLKIAVQDE